MVLRGTVVEFNQETRIGFVEANGKRFLFKPFANVYAPSLRIRVGDLLDFVPVFDTIPHPTTREFVRVEAHQ